MDNTATDMLEVAVSFPDVEICKKVLSAEPIGVDYFRVQAGPGTVRRVGAEGGDEGEGLTRLAQLRCQVVET